MVCPGRGEQRMISFDPVLKRWSCDVCGWSWSWRPVVRAAGQVATAARVGELVIYTIAQSAYTPALALADEVSMCVVGAACAKGWAESLPEDCPLSSAINASGKTLYRFVDNNPPRPEDFWSHEAKGIKTGATLCENRSVSLVQSLEGAAWKHKQPRFKNMMLAEITLPEGCGVVSYGKSQHVHWWPCGAFKPAAKATVIRKYPDASGN
jgi:hypothetical protein